MLSSKLIWRVGCLIRSVEDKKLAQSVQMSKKSSLPQPPNLLLTPQVGGIIMIIQIGSLNLVKQRIEVKEKAKEGCKSRIKFLTPTVLMHL